MISDLFDLITGTVGRSLPLRDRADPFGSGWSLVQMGVSHTSVSNKIDGIEPDVSAALVRYSARQLTPIIKQLGGKKPDLVPGYRVKALATFYPMYSEEPEFLDFRRKNHIN